MDSLFTKGSTTCKRHYTFEVRAIRILDDEWIFIFLFGLFEQVQDRLHVIMIIILAVTSSFLDFDVLSLVMAAVVFFLGLSVPLFLSTFGAIVVVVEELRMLEYEILLQLGVPVLVLLVKPQWRVTLEAVHRNDRFFELDVNKKDPT
jgi:hypothetical protein